MIGQLSQSTSSTKVKVSLKEALFDRKYRFASWNGVISAVINPLAGVAASLFYQAKIFIQLRDSGDFTILPVIWSVQIMNFMNMIASFGSFIPSKFLGQRVNFIGGLHFVYLSLVGLIICNQAGIPLGIIVFVVLHIIFF